MDLLSQVIGSLRAARASSYVIHCHAPWGRRYPPVGGAGVHIVLQGSAYLIPPGGKSVPLEAGDVVLLPAGTGTASRTPRPDGCSAWITAMSWCRIGML